MPYWLTVTVHVYFSLPDTEEESVVVVSERGGVVDLTNDSGVEDEDIVDLTTPIELRVSRLEFLDIDASCTRRWSTWGTITVNQICMIR